jgi:hypothetical protein
VTASEPAGGAAFLGVVERAAAQLSHESISTTSAGSA